MRAHAEDSQGCSGPTVTVNADGTVALSVEPMRARAIHTGVINVDNISRRIDVTVRRRVTPPPADPEPCMKVVPSHGSSPSAAPGTGTMNRVVAVSME